MKTRYFKAIPLKTDNETGIGIIEYHGQNTLYIASLYAPSRLSQLDTFTTLAQHVYFMLDEDEQAVIKFNGPARKGWRVVYDNKMRIVRNLEHIHAPWFYEVRLLAEDAVRRKESITERLDEEGLPTTKINQKGDDVHAI